MLTFQIKDALSRSAVLIRHSLRVLSLVELACKASESFSCSSSSYALIMQRKFISPIKLNAVIVSIAALLLAQHLKPVRM